MKENNSNKWVPTPVSWVFPVQCGIFMWLQILYKMIRLTDSLAYVTRNEEEKDLFLAKFMKRKVQQNITVGKIVFPTLCQ